MSRQSNYWLFRELHQLIPYSEYSITCLYWLIKMYSLAYQLQVSKKYSSTVLLQIKYSRGSRIFSLHLTGMNTLVIQQKSFYKFNLNEIKQLQIFLNYKKKQLYSQVVIMLNQNTSLQSKYENGTQHSRRWHPCKTCERKKHMRHIR